VFVCAFVWGIVRASESCPYGIVHEFGAWPGSKQGVNPYGGCKGTVCGVPSAASVAAGAPKKKVPEKSMTFDEFVAVYCFFIRCDRLELLQSTLPCVRTLGLGVSAHGDDDGVRGFPHGDDDGVRGFPHGDNDGVRGAAHADAWAHLRVAMALCCALFALSVIYSCFDDDGNGRLDKVCMRTCRVPFCVRARACACDSTVRGSRAIS
jgi:hypothetical protein